MRTYIYFFLWLLGLNPVAMATDGGAAGLGGGGGVNNCLSARDAVLELESSASSPDERLIRIPAAVPGRDTRSMTDRSERAPAGNPSRYHHRASRSTVANFFDTYGRA